jgi:outer membrane protein assembly factor BamB
MLVLLKRINRIPILAVLFLALLACGESSSRQNVRNWTHFRGSNLDGKSEGSGFPVRWTGSENVAWRAEIPGRGWSSPVVFGDQVWCTTATLDGKEMYAVCTDFNTGKNLHYLKVFAPDKVFRKHSINSYATPTPAIEPGFVYVHFGRYGTACIDTEKGSIIWKRNDLECRHVQGPGSSPVLYGDLLILHLEGTDVRYIIALDKKTGKTAWKADRPAEPYNPLREIQKKAYITPLVIQEGGRDLLISNGAAVCIAYDPSTGDEIWRIVKGAESTVAMPVESGGLVYFNTGYEVSPEGEKYCELLAVDPGGMGDVTHSHVRWSIKLPFMQLSTPVVNRGLIYIIDSEARFLCLDAKTGETVWSEQLKGKYNSSPILADGRLYFSSTKGVTTVISEGRTMKVLAENTLEGEIWATPAFPEGSILLRTSEYLYRID